MFMGAKLELTITPLSLGYLHGNHDQLGPHPFPLPIFTFVPFSIQRVMCSQEPALRCDTLTKRASLRLREVILRRMRVHL